MEKNNNAIPMNPALVETLVRSRSRRIAWAKEVRNARIEQLSAVDFRVKPTKGVDSGAGGKLFELEQTRETSTKTRVSSPEQVDNYLNMDGRPQAVEMKTNSGEISAIVQAVAQGKDGFIVYSLEMNNANTNKQWRVIPPVIMKWSTFVSMAAESGCIREKRTSRGTQTIALEGSSKKWYIALEHYLESTGLAYNKKMKYNKEMFAGL